MKKLLLSGFIASAVGFAHAETMYAISETNQLVSFNSSAPGTLLSNVVVGGLAAGETIVGIDFRPNGGGLYGVSSASKLYTINRNTGMSTAVGGPFSTLLNGTSFGIDFNPTVDRIRITSNTGQNLRINPITGAVAAVDTNLQYAAGDVNAGKAPGVVGSAYTNSFFGSTTTTLYNIDFAQGVLCTQIPPNNGTLNTIGSLGVVSNEWVGFDISGFTGKAWASLTTPGVNVHSSNFFSMNLTTGAATFVGTIGGGACDRITGLTSVPEPGTIFAIAGGLAAIAARRRRK